MWDERYSASDYTYGKEPNDYLVAQLNRLKLSNGKALCLAEGEGRNAVYLAKLGFEVEAVDQSQVGLKKAHKLAEEMGVSIKTLKADLSSWDPGNKSWDLVVSIWAHMPSKERAKLHQRVLGSLKHGGYFILEAYRPENIGRGTGGPPDPDLTMNLEALTQELKGLEIIEAQEIERDVQEGRYHQGKSAVLQLTMRRP